MRVYHFLSATNALKDISKRRIKIAQFQDLNDPFELLPPDLSDKSMRKAFRAFKKVMEQSNGILCSVEQRGSPYSGVTMPISTGACVLGSMY